MTNHIPEILLNDGRKAPAIGFGTARIRGAEGVESVKTALDLGYRLIDSAFNYENEGVVGEAVRQSGVARDQLFITSKLPGRHHKYEEAVKTIEESLYRAGLDYYDLYLIHWPNPKVNLYVEAWQALIDARAKGLIRSIGVSNFLPEHLDRLIKETGVVPSMNQIELHPFYNQAEQRAYHEKHGIITESWSPLGRGEDLLKNEQLRAIAAARGISVSQIVLRWHVQLGAVPIPRSQSETHQRENIDIFGFELSEEEMKMISDIPTTGPLWEQDPAVYEEF
ncbi:aldo/keto reductase [Paenibacillus sp. FSL R7-0204]|uniref:aldo/keto reductase n=1 Tax=Paenibacillus sp. FSL R7-0204 TaxID=2921675 RepID=UPI0030FA2644